MKKKFIKIPKDFFDGFEYVIKVPTFICSCGEEVLDTPTHRIQSERDQAIDIIKDNK